MCMGAERHNTHRHTRKHAGDPPLAQWRSVSRSRHSGSLGPACPPPVQCLRRSQALSTGKSIPLDGVWMCPALLHTHTHLHAGASAALRVSHCTSAPVARDLCSAVSLPSRAFALSASPEAKTSPRSHPYAALCQSHPQQPWRTPCYSSSCCGLGPRAIRPPAPAPCPTRGPVDAYTNTPHRPKHHSQWRGDAPRRD